MRGESWIERRWLFVVGGLATLVQALSVGRALTGPGKPALNVDSALFQHAGWYVTRGAIPYIDIWDIKPPLVIETTTVLALLAGGDPFLLHLLSVAVMSVAAIGCSLLVSLLAHRLTGDGRAALLAGLTLLTVPGFYHLSAHGFRPKYFTLFFGLAALVLGLRNRPLPAGMAAAASAGYWQYGVIFAVLVVGLALEHRDRRALVRQLLGMALVTTVVLLPILTWGTLVPMLIEVLYVPLTSQSAQPLVQRLGKLVFYLAYALVPAALGVVGLATAARQLPRHWWVYVGAAWGGFQILFDLDSAPDLYLFVVFLALGVALFAERARPRARQWLSVVIVGIVLLNALWVSGVVANPVGERTAEAERNGFVENLTETAESVDVSRPGEPPRHGIPDVRTLYWNTRIPPSCHYRLSETERDWLAKTGLPYRDSTCGNLGELG